MPQSVLRIREFDPESWFFSIQDPGSNNKKEEGIKYLIFKQPQKKLANQYALRASQTTASYYEIIIDV